MLVTPPNFSKSTPLPASRPGEAWSDLSRRGVGPGPGWSPVGNRGAPPRGVDVKPLGRRGRPGPWELPGGLPDPVRGSTRSPVPGTRILGSRAPPPRGTPGGASGRSPDRVPGIPGPRARGVLHQPPAVPGRCPCGPTPREARGDPPVRGPPGCRAKAVAPRRPRF